MTNDEFKKIDEEAKKAIRDPGWTRRTTEKLLPLIQADLEGTINLHDGSSLNFQRGAS